MKSAIPTALLVVLLLSLLAGEGRCGLTMEAGNSLINTYTYYTINITYSGTIDTNGWTILTFPSSDYSSSVVSNSSCSVTCGKTSLSYNLSNSLFVGDELYFNITNILNSGRSGGPIFSYAVFDSAGTSLDGSSLSTITFTPGTLQSILWVM